MLLKGPFSSSEEALSSWLVGELPQDGLEWGSGIEGWCEAWGNACHQLVWKCPCGRNWLWTSAPTPVSSCCKFLFRSHLRESNTLGSVITLPCSLVFISLTCNYVSVSMFYTRPCTMLSNSRNHLCIPLTYCTVEWIHESLHLLVLSFLHILDSQLDLQSFECWSESSLLHFWVPTFL